MCDSVEKVPGKVHSQVCELLIALGCWQALLDLGVAHIICSIPVRQRLLTDTYSPDVPDMLATLLQ